MSYPSRIVCLTEESTEILYRLGEEDRIVGISGFTVRPPEARRDKPKVSAFTSAKIQRILALEPDLVLGFSDLQADIAADLIRQGVNVHVSNQRSVDEILDFIRLLGAMVGRQSAGEALAEELRAGIDDVAQASADLRRRPRVYFEEWDEPRICGIRWVSELIEIAGGTDICRHRARAPLAGDRIIEDDDEIIRAAPDLILGSWCGKRFRPERVASRPGWSHVPAVREGRLHEIKSPLILQPGPAALTDGIEALSRYIRDWSTARAPEL